MPINASYEYFNAQAAYEQAVTIEDKIRCLEEMIRTAPKHKGSENLLSELRIRLKKLIEKKEKGKSVGKTTKKGIRKEGYQCVLIGLTNSGKSSLLARLTNAKPKISQNLFTTQEPEVGTMDYQGVKAQIVDMPALESPAFDSGMANTADCLIIVVTNIPDLQKISLKIAKSPARRLIVFNKADLLSEEELRKLQATIKSKKLSGIIVSSVDGSGIYELKELIFLGMHSIRIYTKEPGKEATKTPVVLPEGSTIKDVAESILKGFSQRVKETRLTGPSSKFPNQKVGLSHILKDKDIVEFHTK